MTAAGLPASDLTQTSLMLYTSVVTAALHQNYLKKSHKFIILLCQQQV